MSVGQMFFDQKTHSRQNGSESTLFLFLIGLCVNNDGEKYRSLAVSTIKLFTAVMEQHAFKNVNNGWSTKYSYLETAGGQSFKLYLNVVNFYTPVLIRHLWQLKAAVFLHWCLICPVLLVLFHSKQWLIS